MRPQDRNQEQQPRRLGKNGPHKILLYMGEMGGGCWHVVPCDHLVIKATFFGSASHFLTFEPLRYDQPSGSLQVVGCCLYFDVPNTAQFAKMYSDTTHQSI